MAIRARYYLGYLRGITHNRAKTFSATTLPTSQSHGAIYTHVVGPFASRKAADYMRLVDGCVTVTEANKAVRS